MHAAVVVRMSSFRTRRPAFDAALRASVIPDLGVQPGVMHVLAGRQGPDEVGARLLISVWSSTASMAAAGAQIGDTQAALPDTTDHQLETFPVVLRVADPEPLSSGVLRVARATVEEGHSVRDYAAIVDRDLAALRASGSGPRSVVIAATDEHAIVMVSTWPDWTAIEAATGASVSEPLRTKRQAGLVDFRADHWELLADLPV